MKKKILSIAKWIDKSVFESNKKGIVFGLSGGIDSAVLAFLSKKYCICNVNFFWLGIESCKSDLIDATLVSKQLKTKLKTFELTDTFKEQSKVLGLENKVSLVNLKARIRASSLYALAQENNSLVCGTSNLAELYVGYFTKFGDSSCDIMPFANIKKYEILGMAEYLGVPSKIINKEPSAGLYEGQKDETELGISYWEIDSFLENWEVSKKTKKIIQKKHSDNIHKLQLPKKPNL